MERNLDREAAIIANDLDSMVHRIEMLEAHPGYTRALAMILEARDAVKNARSDIHHNKMKERLGPDPYRIL